jgi:hypothetical protein
MGLHGITTSKEWGQRFKRPLMFFGIWVAMEMDLTQPPFRKFSSAFEDQFWNMD